MIHDFEDFEPGDVVTLKSGGPPMTINLLNQSTGELCVIWFDEDDHIQHGSFKPTSVIPLEEDAPYADNDE